MALSGISFAPVAQLDRASDFGSECCRFKSCPVHHFRIHSGIKTGSEAEAVASKASKPRVISIHATPANKAPLENRCERFPPRSLDPGTTCHLPAAGRITGASKHFPPMLTPHDGAPGLDGIPCFSESRNDNLDLCQPSGTARTITPLPVRPDCGHACPSLRLSWIPPGL